MRSILPKKPLRSLLTNLVGKGMPERIRSIGFAFLGLTAAAGLALVAVFAQMGFPLLAPAPLPSAPEGQGSVAKAVRLGYDSPFTAIAQAQSAPAGSDAAAGRGASEPAAGGKHGSSAVDGSAVPVSTPTSGDSSGASEPSAVPAPEASPAPAPVSGTVTSEPGPAPVEVPVSSPRAGEKPSTSKPVASKPDTPESAPAPEPSKHEKKTAKPKPTSSPPPKPPRPGKPEATPAPEPSYVPAPAPAPADKGKEKKGK